MRVFTVSDAARQFGVRRADVLAVAEDHEVGRKVGSTFVFVREELDDLEDALEEEGLLAADSDDEPAGDDDGSEDESDDGGEE